MNRNQRRRFNRKNKTNYTKEDFDMAEIYSRIKGGSVAVKELQDMVLKNDIIHIDNEALVPEGTPVKLNYEAIKSRPQKDLTVEFKNWVDQHREGIFHVTREGASGSLVCVKEDVKEIKENFTDEDRNIGHVPWFFDIYSDFLYEDPRTGEWVILAEVEKRKENNEGLKEEE